MPRPVRRRKTVRAIAAASTFAALLCGACSSGSNGANVSNPNGGAPTTTEPSMTTDVLASSDVPSPPEAAQPLLVDRFDRPGDVISDERVWHDDSGTLAPDDMIWAATSGVFRTTDGVGWSDSPVFRAVTHHRDFGDVAVSLRLRVDEITGADAHPQEAWDGVHLLLHYQDETELYAVSVSRRDGEVAIKRKDPGGPSNGGTYSNLAAGPGAVPLGGWAEVTVTIRQVEAGVELTISIDGTPVLAATDDEAVGNRSSRPGRIGIRADNTTFHIDDLVVDPIEGEVP